MFKLEEQIRQGLPTSMKGPKTNAQIVTELVAIDRFKADLQFDRKLERFVAAGDFWVDRVEDPATVFPAVGAGENTVVQPFFIEVGNKLAIPNRTVYRKDEFGQYIVPEVLTDAVLYAIPDATVFNKPTIAHRRPDVNCYYRTVSVTGELSIVFCMEVKGRMNSQAFPMEDIGQVIDTNKELLRRQPFRKFTIAVLSDGVRFQFFQITRLVWDEFDVVHSQMYWNMAGWAVSAPPLRCCCTFLLTYYYRLRLVCFSQILARLVTSSTSLTLLRLFVSLDKVFTQLYLR